MMGTLAARREVKERLAYNQAERRWRWLRALILDKGRMGLLASEILGFKLKTFHQDMIDFTLKHPRTLQLAPRQFGKSSMVTITRAIWEILKNPDVRLLIVSKTQDKAEQFLFAIKQHLERNKALRACFGDYSTSAPKWGVTQIMVPQRKRVGIKEPTITASSVGGPVSSRGYDGIFPDDLVDEDNAYTEHQRQRLGDWWYKVLMPTLPPTGFCHITGTRYHPLDIYGHLIKNEYADSHQVIDCYDKYGESIWPEQKPTEWLHEKHREMGTTRFNTQYRNDTEQMKGRIFREEWFQEYDQYPDIRTLAHFGGCDPAATRGAATRTTDDGESDWWTIVVGGAARDGRIFLRYAWRDRCTKDEYVEKVREVDERFSCVAWGVENVAAQEYLAQDLESFITVERIERYVDKIARAYWLQPKFENALIHFPAPHTPEYQHTNDEDTSDIWDAMRGELLMFPKASHDDLFDGLQSMCQTAQNYQHASQKYARPARTKPMRDLEDY